MNHDPAMPEHEVDRLVNAHLEREAGAVDASRILHGLRAQLVEWPFELEESDGRRSWRAWGMGLATAASLLVAMFWMFQPGTAQAHSVRLVREARDALERPSDRSYRVRVELAPGAAERYPILAVVSRVDRRLITRGDRFWVELTDHAPERGWCWGRDEHRDAWLAPSPHVGLLYKPAEIPDAFALGLELYSMDLKTLLDQVLTDFEVAPDRANRDRLSGVTRIRGTLKPRRQNPGLRAITLDIDDRTKMVRRVVVSRLHEWQAVAEVSFTYEDAASSGDAQYQLGSHLATGAEVYGSDRPVLRRAQLALFLSSLRAAR
jgi:hypothetical protein